jgi:hypothetical protein
MRKVESVLGAIRILLLGWRSLTNHLGLCDIPHGRQARFGIAIAHCIHKLWISLIDLEFATVETDAFEDLLDLIEKAYKKEESK